MHLFVCSVGGFFVVKMYIQLIKTISLLVYNEAGEYLII